MWDHLWLGARLATMREGPGPYGVIIDGALGVKDGRIAFVGPEADLPGRPADLAHDVRPAHGAWVAPAPIDCHTHIVFAGERAAEFEMRAAGARYEDIHRAGGGIGATVRATRAASENELIDAARPRLRALMAEGVSTVEIKSGYGLEFATERRMLRAARRLGRELGLRVHTTFLGAHAAPPSLVKDKAAYLTEIVEEMIPALASEGLVDAVDAFCESIAFTPEETARVFEAARKHGLRVKLHADQISDRGGAALAAKFGALSADHLEHASADGLAAMAKAGTVAVLLPGAYLMLRDTRPPPVALMREKGVRMAVASDANPGSSPARSLLLMLPLACALFGLTPEEALAGVTREAARALGLLDETGTLEAGKSADYCLWDIGHPRELSYWLGNMRPQAICRMGQLDA